MLVEYPYFRDYLFTALEAGPGMIEDIVARATPAILDVRPDPDRFTIREVVAHLAEWEPIWLLRMQAAVEQNEPTMPGYDVDQMAVDHNYAGSDVAEQMALYRDGRAKVIAYLKDRTDADWNRRLNRPEIGWLTLEGLTILPPLHDTYHAKQIVEWKRAASK